MNTSKSIVECILGCDDLSENNGLCKAHSDEYDFELNQAKNSFDKIMIEAINALESKIARIQKTFKMEVEKC